MRWSQALIPTLREAPREAEISSHNLMLRAGMMRRLAAGVYSYLPLGWRAIRKVEQIVREELDRVGCQEILMSVISPAELWRESGRWDVYGKELMRLKDRHDREFALGPTHEEIVTDIVRAEVRSYRELPTVLYQIQVKFRDEIRPRFGVMRCREFSMMDAYSFHVDRDSLDEWYGIMHGAYERIFSRCGLEFKPVLADSGAIGGKTTHEFMVLADSGESVVLNCAKESCGYAATDETAERYLVASSFRDDPQPMTEVDTPNARTIEEVCALLDVSPDRLVKTLLYKTDGRLVAALIPGDRELNEAKFKKVLGSANLEMADADAIRALTGADVGFSGPVGLSQVEIIADNAIETMANFVTGANKDDTHLVNVNVGRDFDAGRYEDLVTVVPGDLCPKCRSPLSSYRGIEVGQIFKLGTKYSESMNATFMDPSGDEKPFVMGCYGIGTTRTVAAAIEQHHDDTGIIWPVSLAPYHVLVLPVTMTNSRIVEVSESLYDQLTDLGVEVLYDDRDERAGVKFKDGDLIGIPFRICVGEKNVNKGLVEVRERRTGGIELVPIDDAAQYVQQQL